MGLLTERTNWVLLLASNGEPEDRHIRDLAFGVFCLEISRISPSDISIYIDGSNRSLISQIFSSGTGNNYLIKKSADFFVDLGKNTHTNMVLFVTGHGSIEGLDAPSPITPSPLLQAIRSAPGLSKAVLYLGQCVAGIFNYVGAGTKVAKEPGADVIIIGATNLHSSISAPTTENIHSGPTPWVANLFLLHVFKWISAPMDVDGDGAMTVMDSYKYAGVMSNNANKDIKVVSFVTSMDLHQKWLNAKATFAANPTLANSLAYQAATDLHQSNLDVRYTHQECWILNAIPAQKLEF
ncbi:hypothetical protein XacyCFBP2565_12220 [Xanthomonas arboricola pv. corylina]|uniref:hypothetical protein n=1 Tax=Xanthomonas arboricola TaxID=56448 RepID=UPI000CEE8896|nr:hypothetical protein [Xanthomonas arboricola]PPU14656.1 hypothetical protein XacyCFBP2565_12220 [Xanthomonas arboricola pv. corylina]